MSIGKIVGKTIEVVGVVTKVGVEMGADAIGYLAEKADSDSNAKEKIIEKGRSIGNNIKSRTNNMSNASQESLDNFVNKIKENTEKTVNGVKSDISKRQTEKDKFKEAKIYEGVEYKIKNETASFTRPFLGKPALKSPKEEQNSSKEEDLEQTVMISPTEIAQLAASRKSYDNTAANIVNKMGDYVYSKLPEKKIWNEDLDNLILDLREESLSIETYKEHIEGELVYNYENYNDFVQIIQRWINDRNVPEVNLVLELIEKIKDKNTITFENGIKHLSGTPISSQGKSILNMYKVNNGNLNTVIKRLNFDFKLSYTRATLAELFLEELSLNTDFAGTLFNYECKEVVKAIINCIDFYSNKKLEI